MKINDNDLIYLVRGKCIDIHKELGPGLLEKAYQLVLTYELENAGFQVDTEVPIPLKYKNVRLEGGFRADMIVHIRLITRVRDNEGIPNGLLVNSNCANLYKEGLFLWKTDR